MNVYLEFQKKKKIYTSAPLKSKSWFHPCYHTKLYEKKCPTYEEDINKRIITSAHTLAHEVYTHDFRLNS